MIRCRGKLLRNREKIQSESATKNYVQDINFSQAFEQSERNGNVRKQEKETVVSVVLVIVGRGEVTAGPHGTAAEGLKLKKLCAFPIGRYLHPEAWVKERKLGVKKVTVGHVTAAVSCCFEMALWRTLWMADQVSLMASDGLSASRMRWLMNFLACGPGRPVVSRMKGTRLMCGYLSNLFFSALWAIAPGFVLAAETRDGLQEKGATMDTSQFVTEP